MQQYICQLHVTVDDTQCPYIFNSGDKLSHNQSAFLLFDLFTHFEEDGKVIPVGILLHHVDI